jgi:hypothetical protein
MTARVVKCLLRLYENSSHRADNATVTAAATTRSSSSSRPAALVAAESCMLSMLEEGLTAELLEAMPNGFSQPFREALRLCRYCAQDDWPSAAFCLVGREDLLSNVTLNPKPSTLNPKP